MENILKRGGNMSAQQKKILIEFIFKYPQLKHGKYTKEFTYEEGRKLWQIVTAQLNALPGAFKEWDKWRKSWHDIKTTSKAKSSKIKRHQKGTGGGPPIKTKLNDDDEKILEIIGPTSVDGHPNIKESAATFEEDDYLMNEVVEDKNVVQDIYVVQSIGENLWENSNHPVLLEIHNINENMTSKEKTPKNAANQTERKIALKQAYYDRKIKLYEEEVEATKQMAAALQSIAKNLARE
ncbi:unnamed protein product [Brassicogethes aeneus]|uniref:Regulatory protein zeste n=1 Tax=Brassicogethes aeneus TaxID=1431903 RepID=A0A9P0AR81_BRAAE|nr:unnamed protein product [Brassicogethes aeneus]